MTDTKKLKVNAMDKILEYVKEHKEDDYYNYQVGIDYINGFLDIIENYYSELENN